MSRRVFNSVLKKVKTEYDGCHLTFHGGEPSLNIDLLHYAAKKIEKLKNKIEITASIQTNGTLIVEYPEFVKEYYKLFNIGISFDGKSSKYSNRFRLNPIYWRHRDNDGHSFINGFCKLFKYKLDNNDKIEEVRLRDYVSAYLGHKPSVCLSMPCHAGLDFLDILPDGTVCPCDSFGDVKIGNIIKERISDIIFSEKTIDFRFGISEIARGCELCEYVTHCGGGWCVGFCRESKNYCPKELYNLIAKTPFDSLIQLSTSKVKSWWNHGKDI
jgi:radical SAM protein with 4Fe4S-binding SPASM domain